MSFEGWSTMKTLTDYSIKKEMIGLLASITFEIVNQSEYDLRLWNYLHLGENVIRFGSVVTKK